MTNLVIFVLAHAGEAHDGGISFADLPPVHPILVNFTAALVPISLGSDVLGRLFKRESLRHAGWWTMLFAAMITPLTVLAGWLWLREMPDMNDMREMSIHKWLGTGLAVLLPLFAWWRGRFHSRGIGPGWSYLAILALAVGGLMAQGHLGGMMSFGGERDATLMSPMAHSLTTNPTSQPAMPAGHHHATTTDTSAASHDLGNGWKDQIQIK